MTKENAIQSRPMGEERRRAPVLLFVIALTVIGSVAGAMAVGWRINRPLPDSMAGERPAPGTNYVVDLSGLGMVAVDFRASLPRTPPLVLNSADGVLHVELASPETLIAGSPGQEDLEAPVSIAIAKADIDAEGEFGVSVEFFDELTDRDPPVRYFIAYSRTLEIACLLQIKDDTDPLALANRVFRAVRPADTGESGDI